jgi:hypothetical protein
MHSSQRNIFESAILAPPPSLFQAATGQEASRKEKPRIRGFFDTSCN